MTPRYTDLTGKKFSRLTPIRLVGKDARRKALWLCRCDCGNEKIIRGDSLVSGNTLGCGCINREHMRRLGKNRTTHGEARQTTEYSTWASMKQRCYDENNSRYIDYGGRGITVDPIWRNSFSAFLSDMGRKPSRKHSLDRVDNDKGYYKENCRWATASQQALNRRKRHGLS